MKDALKYEGKRVIVTGAASGTGEATATILVDLGAEVHAIDVSKPAVAGLASFSECDLRDPAQIDATIRKIGKIVNALFGCAGLPNPSPGLDVMLVNFCGLRAVTEAVIPLMIEGSSIASITSTAVVASPPNAELVSGLIATADFAGARAWCEERPKELRNASRLSKEAVNAYTALRSFDLAPAGIRINCVDPAPIDFPVPLGRHAGVEEQAWPLVFLNSPRSSFVTGTQFVCDGGLNGGLVAGRIDASVLVPEGFAED